jgi:nucleotide-binding universal stress UspA family protein
MESAMNRALVALDLSPAMEPLVASLPGLLDFGIDTLDLVHVAPPVSYPASEAISRAEQIRGRLGTLRESLEAKGFSVSIDVPFGAPAPTVRALASSKGADLIVVGSRSHTRVREAFVGSVAWEIVRTSGVPVLLRKLESNRPDPEAALEVRGPGLPTRVIFPTDFSEVADRALPWVDWLLDRGVSELVLLHVHEAGDEDARREGKILLDGLADRFTRRGFNGVRTEVRGGVPSEEILRAGGDSPDHLVIMGTTGRGTFPELLLGSQSRQVVRAAGAPVLLVP